MAQVFQLIVISPGDPHLEGGLINEDWHAAISAASGPRTICGIQLEGNDGIGPGLIREGKVTCRSCLDMIEQIKAIRRWQ